MPLERFLLLSLLVLTTTFLIFFVRCELDFLPVFFGQFFDQILARFFVQKYRAQFFWDGEVQCVVLLGRRNTALQHSCDRKIQCTVLLGRKNPLHRITSKKVFAFLGGHEQK